MICPYCNMNMKKGYLQSARPSLWSDKKKDLFFTVDKSYDIKVTKGYWTGCYADAWVCRRCKKMIVDLDI